MHDMQERAIDLWIVPRHAMNFGHVRVEKRHAGWPLTRGLGVPEVLAVGTADWSGTPLRLLLEEAGLSDNACEVVFTGHDHGIEGDVKQDYQRSLSIPEVQHDDVLLVSRLRDSM